MKPYAAALSAYPAVLAEDAVCRALDAFLESQAPLRRVLLLPPDFTRFYSCAGPITAHLYARLREMGAEADVMPALGTHAPMTAEEIARMYPGVPAQRFLIHRWREDVVRLGEVPAGFCREVSQGVFSECIPVSVNKRLLCPDYDLILSIGQVVPHEVAGMANRNKNLFVGLGGSEMINASHMLGAAYGAERVMGRDFSPVRRVFDYAEERFLAHLPLCYLLTVATQGAGGGRLHGLFIGRERALFERAVALSQQANITWLDQPLPRAVVYLEPEEFKSTWLGNKAVYRTRMALAPGGELVILAPGVRRFGEDAAVDALIRRYGYCGRERVLALLQTEAALRENRSAAAHLIHGSADGRFRIIYAAPHLTDAEIRGVDYDCMPYQEACRRYLPADRQPGFHQAPDGEPFYFIPNPALGLWMCREEK